MRHSLLIISLFLFYGLHAQKVSGYWYGQANVEMSGIQNNYLTELIIVQKGTKVRGFFGYYFKDVYQSFLVKGSYDPQSRQIIIRDIPIIYFNTNSTSASVECITSFYGKLLVSRVKSTLTGYFYRDKKYEYTCPDIRVNYTLYPESNVEDSVFKDIVVTKSYWKPQPNAFADNHQKEDSTVSATTTAANGKSIPGLAGQNAVSPTDSLSGTSTSGKSNPVQAVQNGVSPTDSLTRTSTTGKSIPVQAGQNMVSPTDSLTLTGTSGKSIPVQAGLARLNPADSLTRGGSSKQVSLGAGASDMVKPVANQDLVKISEDYKKRKSLVGKEIEVSSDSIRLSFYDDAIVDGDSISVFFNNQLILAHQELTEKAFNLYIKLDSLRETNEVSMFAENLGKYPPNTALMVVSDGENRYEVFLSSDFKGNATVRFKRKKTQ